MLVLHLYKLLDCYKKNDLICFVKIVCGHTELLVSVINRAIIPAI